MAACQRGRDCTVQSDSKLTDYIDSMHSDFKLYIYILVLQDTTIIELTDFQSGNSKI